MCECLQLTIEANGFPESVLQSNASGVYNGENYWEYDYNGIIIVIWFIADVGIQPLFWVFFQYILRYKVSYHVPLRF